MPLTLQSLLYSQLWNRGGKHASLERSLERVHLSTSLSFQGWGAAYLPVLDSR